MLGLRALSDMPEEPDRNPTYSSNPTSWTNSNSQLAARVYAASALQAQGAGGGDIGASVAATLDGIGLIPIASEQPADTAAATARTARVAYAARAGLVRDLYLEMDTDVPSDPTDYATFTVKKHANGGAISSALANPISTAELPFTARTKRTFTWTGDINLAAGEMLVVDITKTGAGVALPKFKVAGYMRSL